MRRAYRPRLSKDKAIAQRVVEELEREDVFITKRATSLDVGSNVGSTGGSSARAPSPTSARPGAASAPMELALPPPSESLQPGAVSSASREDFRRENVACSTIPTKTSNDEAPHEDTEINVATSGRHASAQRSGPLIDMTESDGGNICNAGWPCLSCSFINSGVSRKCSMCGTKNFRPRAKVTSTIVKGAAEREPLKRQRNARDCSVSLEKQPVHPTGAAGSPGEHEGLDGSEDGTGRRRSPDDDGGCLSSFNPPQRKRRRNSTGSFRGVHGTDVTSIDTHASMSGGRRRRRSCVATSSAKRGVEYGDCPDESRSSNVPPRSRRGRKRERGTPAVAAVIAAGLEAKVAEPGAAVAPVPHEALGSSTEGETASCPSRAPSGIDERSRRSDQAARDTAASAQVGLTCDSISPAVVGMSSSSLEVETTILGETTAHLPSESHQVGDKRHAEQRSPRRPSARRADTGQNACMPSRAGVDAQATPPARTTEKLSDNSGGKRSTPSNEITTAAGSPEVERFSSLPGCSPTRSSPERYPWPVASPAARLVFGQASVWEVTSVVVTHGHGSELDGEGLKGARIVVCHAGGVSAWALTDAEAVCTHVSPFLAGRTSENLRGRFSAMVLSSASYRRVPSPGPRPPRGLETCIVAIGRHETGSGLPIIRVWRGLEVETDGSRSRRTPQRQRAPSSLSPVVLTTILKKKFSSFFPPAAAGDDVPALCLCGHCPMEGEDGAEGTEEKDDVGEITCVMALGGKAVRIVCAPGRTSPEDVRAKALPTGSLVKEGAFSSLAAVPRNPFLVWASIPSAGAILLWDVRALALLFTLRLKASSICVPAVPLEFPLRDGYASGSSAGSPSVPDLAGTTSSQNELGRKQSPCAKRPSSRLLCVLATGTRDLDSDQRSSGRLGCRFYGVHVIGVDDGEALPGCRVAAIGLDGIDDVAASGNQGRCSGSPKARSGIPAHCVACLSDADGFVATVDERGSVVARNVVDGETCELVAEDNPGSVTFASVDCDRRAGLLAVSRGRALGCAATTVDVYTLRPRGSLTTRKLVAPAQG